MPFEFTYELASSWPPLAWLARCEAGSHQVHVIHGSGVECRPDWFCEGVWDADFDRGDFDRTDLIFGSGGRSRQTTVTFVSSGATVDRLQFAVTGNNTFVSNSLPGLLEGIGARLDPKFRGYDEYFEQVIFGLDHKLPDLPLAEGSVGFMYFHNLEWDGQTLKQSPKPDSDRDFSSFEKYVEFFSGALRRIGENMASSHRSPPLQWLGTISKGYDSPVCAALAKEAGLKLVFTHDESRPGLRDDGVEIARILGLECKLVDRLAWRSEPCPEPEFLVADAQGKEVLLAGMEDLGHRVMLTGHGGDRAWSKRYSVRRLSAHPTIEPGPIGTLVRRWHSGLSMTEHRLHAGFIHLAAPFMGLRQLEDLLKLSNSPELAPWDVTTSYSRPICRRILEERGVPRNYFGQTKTGASIRFLRGQDAWSPGGQRAFFRWLRDHGPDHGLPRRALAEVKLLSRALEMVLPLERLRPEILGRTMHSIANRLARAIKARDLNDLAFIWAIETVRKSYRRPPA